MRDIKKLPKWAQEYIKLLESKINAFQPLEQMNAIISDKNRSWFTVHPVKDYGLEYTNLYVLRDNDALAVCSLGKNDLLFVGRHKNGEV